MEALTMLRIGAFAELTAVTPRLLRHYEAVGVLSPAMTDTRTRYRFYTREQVPELQRILMYRAAGIPLSAMPDLLGARGHGDRTRALLELRRAALQIERDSLDRTLALLDAELGGRAQMALPVRPFRIKRTAPSWVASVRRVVGSYADADTLMQETRASIGVRGPVQTAAIWHRCRPAERQIDCEIQVMVSRPPTSSRHPSAPHVRQLPRELVVSFAHTGADAELSAIYDEMGQWSAAARYRVCGPLREVYWAVADGPPITEVQFPVCAA
jgi:DNA-binding transcriptional MerR regulator